MSYSLEVDDGLGGDYQVLTGSTIDSLATSHVMTDGVEKGRVYRARYRVKNKHGWSSYSPVASILAASVPSSPGDALSVSSVTDDDIILTVRLSTENNGSPISLYSLEINAGGI